MLEKEFEYYVEHQDELVKEHDGKVIILKNGEVLGEFESISEGYFHAKDQGWLGEVMIHLVGPGEDNYTTHISSSWAV